MEEYMEFKLFFKLVLLCTAFSSIMQPHTGGRARLSLDEINTRKQLYFQSSEYKKLLPEVKSLVDKFAFQTLKICDNFYRFTISGRGVGRENEFTLLCVVNGKFKTISELLRNDEIFKNWINYSTFDSKGKWIGTSVLGNLDLDNSKFIGSSVVKPLSEVTKYIHKTKPDILPNTNIRTYLNAVQSEQALYKKLLDGLSTKSLPMKSLPEIGNLFLQGSTKLSTEKVASLASNAAVNNVAEKVASSANKVAQANSLVFFKSALSLAKNNKYVLAGGGGVVATAAGVIAYNKYGVKEEPVNTKIEETKKTQDNVVGKKDKSVNEQQFNEKFESHNGNTESSSGLAQLSQYCQTNPGKTVGGIAAIALGYGAYKLYHSDIFAESKKAKEKAQ